MCIQSFHQRLIYIALFLSSLCTKEAHKHKFIFIYVHTFEAREFVYIWPTIYEHHLQTFCQHSKLLMRYMMENNVGVILKLKILCCLNALCLGKTINKFLMSTEYRIGCCRIYMRTIRENLNNQIAQNVGKYSI